MTSLSHTLVIHWAKLYCAHAQYPPILCTVLRWHCYSMLYYILLFVMLLFLENLYIKKLFLWCISIFLFVHCTSVIRLSHRCQLLRSDSGVESNEPRRKLRLTFFCKVIQTMINLTDLFLSKWSQESLSLIDFNLANMHKWNIIFSDLDYFLNWVESRPIVNSKPTWVNPFR